jgi:tetratricopeptide (TPR) repeat protein
MSALRAWALAPALVLLAAASAAEVYVWIDAEGVTHVTDDPASVPGGASEDRSQQEPSAQGRQALTGLWDEIQGPEGAVSDSGSGSSMEADRTRRLIRGAATDLARGETARATAALQSVLRQEPGNPEAHWYLALLNRQRGRYQASEEHLRAFLATAGDDLEPWRASAQRRLSALEDEKRLVDEAAARQPAEWVGVSHPDFRVRYDSMLGEASPDYATTVLRYLGDARKSVQLRLGAVPVEPMGVILYGKAAYLEAHRHRFSFQTVGFFDGRIHVVSAAHPAGELRALLFHEYAHAVYREQTGGDRPYWLNEGLAELTERSSRGSAGLTRSERMALRRRLDGGEWISLRRLAPSFAGLADDDARAAYIESMAAASWIEERSEPADRARLLALLAQGVVADRALTQVLGVDTDGVDAGVREQIRSEFPRPLDRIPMPASAD